MKSTNEVMLRTGDLAKTKAYYHGVLGFPVVLHDLRRAL
jgi:catechol 2,3-dioxygenase-like lactoylglutathione lyase family enzyme